jgi:hypothetical protein
MKGSVLEVFSFLFVTSLVWIDDADVVKYKRAIKG